MKKVIQYIAILLTLTQMQPCLCGTRPLPIDQSMFELTDKIKVRVTFVPGHRPVQGDDQEHRAIVIFQGRASFFEKSTEFFDIISGRSNMMSSDPKNPTPNVFTTMGCDLWIIDHRGHGPSGGRLAPDDQRDHIDSFDTYLKDFDHVIQQKVRAHYKERNIDPIYYLMGISMGGHLAFRYQQEYAASSPFSRLLLVVPMIRFKTAPYPEWFAKALVYSSVYWGWGKEYAIGYGPIDPDKLDFQREKSHHNPEAFEENRRVLKTNPTYIVGGPTYGWVAAAFKSVDESFREANIQHSQKTPTTIFVATDDVMVDPSAALELVGILGDSATGHVYGGSWHNLPKEIDRYRLPFLSDLYSAILETDRKAARANPDQDADE